jgi:hypothetical protein
MKRKLPKTPAQWLKEINLALDDAREAIPFGPMAGQPITDANLFHLAPLVCLKFRGLDFRDDELREKVTRGALATYVANSSPDGIDHGLDSKPLLAFAVCYVTAHFVLDMIDEEQASAILDHCEEKLD